jgi:hypothetical protein
MVVTAVALGVIGTSPARAKTSYVLSCRGGGNMMMEVSSGSESTSVKIVFNRGNYAGTAQPVRSGDCTWIDRGMLESEPNVLHLGVNDALAAVVVRANGTVDRFNYFYKESARSIDKLRYLIDSVLQDRPFQVHAYAERHGRYFYLKATRIGP